MSEGERVPAPATQAARSQATARGSSSARTAAWAAHPAAASNTFCFAPEAEGLTQPQIERGVTWSGAVIDGRQRPGWRKREVIAISANYLPVCARKPGPVVKNRVVVIVLPGGDVVRRSGVDDDERKQREAVGHGNAAADECTMAYIKRGATVIGQRIKLIANETRRAGATAGKESSSAPT